MNKKILLFFSVLTVIILSLSACSSGNNANETTAEETGIAFETTTFNVIPNNEFPAEKLDFEPAELLLNEDNKTHTEYFEDGSTSDIYEYKESGFVEQINYDENGDLRNYSKTVYDEKGRTGCEYVYRTDKSFNYACLHEYDSLGRYSRYYFYNSECKLVCYQVVTYDGYGNDLPVEMYDTEGNLLSEFPDVFD